MSRIGVSRNVYALPGQAYNVRNPRNDQHERREVRYVRRKNGRVQGVRRDVSSEEGEPRLLSVKVQNEEVQKNEKPSWLGRVDRAV